MTKLLYQKSAVEIIKLLRKKEISALDLVEASINRIESIDPKVNALPMRFFEIALSKAKKFNINKHLKNPKSLMGLPIAVKDYNDVKDVISTYGSPIFKYNKVKKSDATIIRLQKNGAIPIAKSNVPEWAGGHTCNPVYGLTKNPWSSKKSAGGSSGGSAVALATGQVWLATGNDLGGSLRTPAAFNGIVGLRPSPGVIPRGCSYPSFDTLWVEGPMARTVEDVALMLDAGAGHYKHDPLSFDHKCRSFSDVINAPLKAKRVAFSPDLGILPISKEISEICSQSMEKLAANKIQITDKIPNFTNALDCFHTLRGILMATMMKELVDKHKIAIPQDILKNIQFGFKLTSDKIIEAERVRWELNINFNEFFKSHDFLICPTTAVAPFDSAFPYVKKINGQTCRTYIDWFAITFALTLTSCPILSLPCGFTKEGLPVGIQIVGKPRHEDELLSFGKFVQDLLGLSKITPIDPKT